MKSYDFINNKVIMQNKDSVIYDEESIKNAISFITGNSNNENSKVPFSVLTAIKIIYHAVQIFKTEEAVLTINSKQDVIVVGDIHGSIESLLSIFKLKGEPSKTKYIFLGDYVNRGNKSCEVIILLYAYKCLYPNNIYLLRGNHEFKELNGLYGFIDECNRRIKIKINGKIYNAGVQFYERIAKSFEYLPICAILNNNAFCVHGGISNLIDGINVLKSIEKVGEKFQENSIQTEFLWNDPCFIRDKYRENNRGIGYMFNNRALHDFLRKTNLKIVIRAHQSQTNGFKYAFGKNGGILTVFSSVNYCGESNKGAFAIVSNYSGIEPHQFTLEKEYPVPFKTNKRNCGFMDDALCTIFFIFSFFAISLECIQKDVHVNLTTFNSCESISCRD